MTTTFGSAKWQGGIKDGKGAILHQKRRANGLYPYGFASRFEGKPGSNPEELIGAAHSRLFHHGAVADPGRSQAHRRAHGNARPMSRWKSRATVLPSTSVHLHLTAKFLAPTRRSSKNWPGMAKAGCPVSKLLNTKITLEATLL